MLLAAGGCIVAGEDRLLLAAFTAFLVIINKLFSTIKRYLALYSLKGG